MTTEGYAVQPTGVNKATKDLQRTRVEDGNRIIQLEQQLADARAQIELIPGQLMKFLEGGRTLGYELVEDGERFLAPIRELFPQLGRSHEAREAFSREFYRFLKGELVPRCFGCESRLEFCSCCKGCSRPDCDGDCWQAEEARR